MRSAFFPFHVATTGLHTARANLTTVAHNIANAEIPGFSRQVAQQQAHTPLHLRDGRGMYGTGSTTTGITQIRNRFLDMKFWHQTSSKGEHFAKTTHLTFIETVFNNLNEAGVLATFNTFFANVQYLTGNAQDATFRTNVITTAETLAEQVRSQALALQRQQRDINREVSDTVMIINSLGNQIASLNQQIHIFERDGSNANDLRDRRNLLLDELSQFVNIEVQERDFSRPGVPNDVRTTVLLNGHDFVRHDMAFALEVVPRTADQRRNEMDVDGLYDIQFAGGIGSFDIHNPNLRGQLRGLIDVRDGNNTQATVGILRDYPITHPYDRNLPLSQFNNPPDRLLATSHFKGIPFYMNQLNHLVRVFSGAINEGRNADGGQIQGVLGHINGFDLDGRNARTMMFTYTRPDGTQGTVDTMPRQWQLTNGDWVRTADGTPPDIAALVTAGSLPAGSALAVDDMNLPIFRLDYRHVNALNFAINQDLLGDPRLLAASSNPDQGESNNDVIVGFNVIGNYRNLFREGRLMDFIIAVSDHLAVDTNQAMHFTLSFTEITIHTHNQRLSIKGVDINEEMMDMVRFQHLFTAASRLINVLDQIYDTMINRMGNF